MDTRNNRNKLKDKEYEILVQISNKKQESVRIDIVIFPISKS